MRRTGEIADAWRVRRLWRAATGSARLEESLSATMALILGALFLAGALIGALSLVLPHPSEYDEPALWSNIVLAFVGGVGLVALHRRLPEWAMQIAVLAGTLVVTRAVFYGKDPGGYYTIWYLWVGVYAYFFFGRVWGTIQLGAIGAAYAWALASLDSTTPVARWVVTIGSLAVAGLLVDLLAARLRREMAASANRAGNLEAVGEVARQLATQSDLRAVGWAICTAAVKATDASAAVLWRPTTGGAELSATAAAGAEIDGAEVPFLTPDSGAIRSFTSAETRFENLERTGGAQELAPRFRAGAALWQPVLSDGVAVAGVLAVYWSDAREEVQDEARQATRLLSLEAAIAIERGELLGALEQAARTDDLTGLHNRRAWSSELGRELSRAAREGDPLSVAVLDLDSFKLINDEHGHQAGDRFLKQLAGIWSDQLRSTDILARHGGDEFALAMPNTDPEHAEAMLERLREVIPDGQTCSAGICAWNGAEGPEALLSRADAALYAAKEAGRNRIVAG